MKDLLKHIESLHHLAAFEAAARHESFTRAAAELNVSQPAVSWSIRRLEAAIGVPLFQRQHRSVTLTDAGELLAHDVTMGFDRILATVSHLRRLSESDHVTLSVSTAFANFWMVPRLQAFHEQHPGIDLRLQTTDKELDLAQEGIALGVRRGNGNWNGYASGLIAEEQLLAVASSGWVEAHGMPENPGDITRLPLIHLEEPYRQRPSWRDWFAGFGVDYRDTGGGLRLNDYALVLQAAMAGEGVAMGYLHVTKSLIAQNLLKPVGPWEHLTGLGYHLVWSDRTQLSDNATTVRDWILAQSD